MFNRIAAASLVALVALAPAAAAHDLSVAVEHAEVVRLPANASAIVVGNPSIADALVHDGRTLVVTGRLPGRTNVIALDRVGRIIFSRDIVVSNEARGDIAVYRGTERTTLSCGTTCSSVPRVGDEPGRTEALTSQQGARLDTANAGVGESGGSGE